LFGLFFDPEDKDKFLRNVEFQQTTRLYIPEHSINLPVPEENSANVAKGITKSSVLGSGMETEFDETDAAV
jgi:hypothetical protein